MVEIKWVRREDSAEVYANFYYFNWSIVDLRIRFGQLIPTDKLNTEGKPESVSEEQAVVTMSWATWKAFHAQLSDILAKQEKVNGPIDVASLKLAE